MRLSSSLNSPHIAPYNWMQNIFIFSYVLAVIIISVIISTNIKNTIPSSYFETDRVENGFDSFKPETDD